MNHKNFYLSIAILLVVAVFTFYQLANTETAREEVVATPVDDAAIHASHSATVDYDVPGGSHRVEFTIAVDEAGLIQKVTAFDVTDPDHQGNVDKFADAVTVILAGKKLDELEAIDKVGTSSLTTWAFNDSLAKIQEQL